MKEIFLDLLKKIPDYKTFLTLDELDQSSFRLAERFPELVSVFSFGKSKEGRELYCLKIGSGSKNALMFGCPHPNEPIGTMMLEYFTGQLAENEALRNELDYTWYVVKAWDADGLKRNERWLKGPYDLYYYSRYFFRPAGNQQVDWTFPVDYKNLHFDRAIPETKAMMKLIDEVQPAFIYSLHNAGFGGVYWYLSGALEPLYPELHRAAERVGIPLNLGEPEVPWIGRYAPAIYESLGIEDEYDYLEQYGEEHPEEKIHCGNCSETYARKRYGSFTLLTELPYFYDARIMDSSESRRTRRECVLEQLAKKNEEDTVIRRALAETAPYVAADNQYRMALEAFTEGSGDESRRKMAESDPEYARLATVAEEFDSLVLSRFYKLLSFGMVIGMCEDELARIQKPADDPQRVKLEAVMREFEAIHRKQTEEVEAMLNYEVVPIRKLVSIQLECGLLVSSALNPKSEE